MSKNIYGPGGEFKGEITEPGMGPSPTTILMGFTLPAWGGCAIAAFLGFFVLMLMATAGAVSSGVDPMFAGKMLAVGLVGVPIAVVVTIVIGGIGSAGVSLAGGSDKTVWIVIGVVFVLALLFSCGTLSSCTP